MWLLAPAREAGAWGFAGNQSGVGLRLGPVYPNPTNDFDVASRAGTVFALGYFRCPSDWFTWGLEVDRSVFHKGTDPIVAGANPPTRISGNTLAELLTARINLIFDQPWTVYVLGGAGWHQTSATINSLAATDAKAKGSGRALTAGAGAEMFFLKNVSALFEARWEEHRLNRGVFGVDAAETLSYQAGINFRFGAK